MSNRKTKLAIWIRDKWKCRYCGVLVIESGPNIPHKATVDHILPVSKGGKNNRENLVTACCKCNSHKGNQIEPRPYIRNGRIIKLTV